MTDKQTAALRLAKELDGVIADVEEGMGFDDVCLGTIKYVRDALAEQPNIAKYLEKDNSEQPAQHDDSPPPEYCKGYADGLEAGAISEKKPAQQQKPVAWRYNGILHEFDPSDWATGPVIPLYTSPPVSKPLTDEQIMEMYNEPRSDAEMLEFARAIEAAHGIKGDA